MNTPQESPGLETADKKSDGGGPLSVAVKRLVVALVGLALCFSRPLHDLVLFSAHHDLYSHINLIPFISLYLIWLQRASLPPGSAPNRAVAGWLLAAGVVLLASDWALVWLGRPLENSSSLALTTLSFVCLVVGLCGAFLGRATFRALAFPFGFLVFMVPMPVFLTEAVESFLQYGSTFVATTLLTLCGTPVFREELVLQLQGIRLQVAPECSGIHSSLALLITSVLAGFFFLRSPGNRLILALAVIPLALLRNGFRVFTIGELCVHIGPHMIDSYIHRHGGPFFFALSLIPFFALLFWLIKVERKRSPRPTAA